MTIRQFRRLFRTRKNTQRLIYEECHIQTAVLVPFVFLNGEYCLIFETRAGHIRQGGEVSFPGGVFDPSLDKTTKDTALRETEEELGIGRKKVRVYGSIGTLIGGNGAVIDVYPGTLDIRSLPELDWCRDEVADVFAVPAAYFLNTDPEKYAARVELKSRYVDDNGREMVSLPAEDLGLPERYYGTWGVRNHTIYLYRYGGHVIWGITARIIQELKRIWKTKG